MKLSEKLRLANILLGNNSAFGMLGTNARKVIGECPRIFREVFSTAEGKFVIPMNNITYLLGVYRTTEHYIALIEEEQKKKKQDEKWIVDDIFTLGADNSYKFGTEKNWGDLRYVHAYGGFGGIEYQHPVTKEKSYFSMTPLLVHEHNHTNFFQSDNGQNDHIIPAIPIRVRFLKSQFKGKS